MRITKLQNEIYKSHKSAWKNNDWDFEHEKISLKDIRDNKTSKLLWFAIVEDVTSITSQLMMSDFTFGVMSNVAKKEIRNGFKMFLNKYNIK